jgi:hypothetical protein
MSLLKHLDRIAMLSVLSVSLGLPAVALAYSVQSPAGKILGTEQVLTEANIRSINAGMSAAEVLARIGPPSGKTRFERTKTTSWDYHITDPWSYDSEFSVVFNDSDIVVSKFLARNGQ